MTLHQRNFFWFAASMGLSLVCLFLSACGGRSSSQRNALNSGSGMDTDTTGYNITLPSRPGTTASNTASNTGPNAGTANGGNSLPVNNSYDPPPVAPTRYSGCSINPVSGGYFQVGREASFDVWDQLSYTADFISNAPRLFVTNVWTTDPQEIGTRPYSVQGYGSTTSNRFSIVFRSPGSKTIFVRVASLNRGYQTGYCDTQLNIQVNQAAAASLNICAIYPWLCNNSGTSQRCSFAAESVGVRNGDCGSNSCNRRVEATFDGIFLPRDATDIRATITSLYLDNDDRKAKVSINGVEVIRETQTQPLYHSVQNVPIGHTLRGGNNSVKASVRSARRYWSASFTVSGEYSTRGTCEHFFSVR